METSSRLNVATPRRRSRAHVVVSLAILAGGCSDSTTPTDVPSADAANGRNMVRLAQLGFDQLAPGTVGARGSGNWGYTTPNGRRYALTGLSVGLSIVDVTSPSQPRVVGLVPGPVSNWREVKTYGHYAYVTTEAEHGLDIVDLSNPDQPRKVRTFTDAFARAHTLWIDAERRLLFANGTHPGIGGVRILSLDDPEDPREVGAFDGYYVHDAYLQGDVLFAAAIRDGFLGLIDVRDPARPSEIARLPTGGSFTHNAWPTPDGLYVFTTDERPGRPLEGWDIRDPHRPRKVMEYIGAPGTIPHNVMVDAGRLLVSHYSEGVHLLDVRDPERPSVLGFFDTYQGSEAGFVGAWGAYVFPGTNLILASDINSGLHVIEYRP